MAIGAEGPFTVTSLVDEIGDVLHSYTRDQEMRTSLAAPMSSTDQSFTVTDATQVSRGLVEIEDEVVQVSQVDPATGVATVEPWGRAQSGSVADSHAQGVRVTAAPLYPRQRIRTAIYGVLREIFPDVFGVAETTLDYNPAQTNYALPADCYQVLQVQWKVPGPSGMWAYMRRWRQNKTASGGELELLGFAWPGQGRVRVEYMRTPPDQIQGTDDLATYGYDYQIRDLIVLGTVARLMAYTETSRVQSESVVSHGRSEAVPAGSAVSLSRYLYQQFQQRLASERAQQLLRHPIQPHVTR